jgi:hypothetical protein
VIPDHGYEVLAPLHKTLYDFLSTKSWLLVGPPSVEKVSSVCQQAYQTSVDFVSATDNLRLDASEAILGSLLSKASKVPGAIRLRAFRTLNPLVERIDGTLGEVTHGQMMGGYLSFPLLCLHSYLSALWAAGDGANILVNGDDTLISSHSPILASSYPQGYVMNVKKTIIAENVAEINSTSFLRGKEGKWRRVDHLRRGGFLADFPGMLHAAAVCRGSVAWTDAFIRSRVGKRWGFLPSQLSLSAKSYVAFQRSHTIAQNRYFTYLPTAPCAVSESLLGVRRPLDPDEALATALYLFDNGREGGRKRDVFSPTIGKVRRSYGYLKRLPWKRISYRSYSAALKLPSRVKEDIRFVPQNYISYREEMASRELRLWVILQD